MQKELFKRGIHNYILDGDNIRKGLNSDLGFSQQDRSENIRRVSEVARLFADAGHVVITAFISPYQKDRDFAKSVAPNFFHNIYIKAELAECQKRDPKGLYKKAKSGEIKNLTGVGDVYEEPTDADLVIDTSKNDIAKSVEILLQYVRDNF